MVAKAQKWNKKLNNEEGLSWKERLNDKNSYKYFNSYIIDKTRACQISIND